jgi:hypothetical protein
VLTAQSKVESIKVFLGVLGNDVLHRDLSSIDPRRLARGELKEVAYVGGLLVQVAKQNGMLSHAGEEVIDVDPESSYSDSVIDDFNRLRVGDYNKDDGQDDEEYEPSFDTSAGTSSYSGDLLKTPPQTPMYLRFQMEMQSTTTNTPRGNPLSPRELNLQKLSSPISQSPPTSPTYRSPYGSYSSRQSSSNQVRTSPSVPTTTYRSNISSTIQPETNKLSLSQRSKPSSSSSPAPDRSSTPPLRPLPEKESTPPTTVKKPLYMGYKPSPGRHAPGSSSPITSPASSSSPPVYIRTPKQRSAHWMYAREEEEEGIEERQAAVVVEHSTCSCAMTVGDDETVSTVNCHCEIHGEDLSTYQEPAMYEEEPRDGDRYKQKQGSVYKGPSYREQHYSGSIGRRGYDGYTAEFITGGGPRSGESEDDAWARRGLVRIFGAFSGQMVYSPH